MTWLSFALLTALFSSLTSLYEKHTLRNIHTLDYALAIATATAALTFPALFYFSWSTVTPSIVLLIILNALIAATAFLYVTRGIRHLEISAASPLFLLGPLITALLAFLLLGEHISLPQILGMLVLCAGTYILETSRLTHGKEFMTNIWGNSHARNIMIGLLLYGCSSVGDRIILGIHTVPPLLYTALIQLCIAFFFVLYVWKKNGSPKSTFDAMRGSWMAILVLALLTIAYRVFQGYATALAAVGLVIAIKRSSSLITTVIGGEVFHEHNIWRKAGACLIMTLGVFLIASK